MGAPGPTVAGGMVFVGSGYIAGAHSAAYRTVAGTYPDVPRDAPAEPKLNQPNTLAS